MLGRQRNLDKVEQTYKESNSYDFCLFSGATIQFVSSILYLGYVMSILQE